MSDSTALTQGGTVALVLVGVYVGRLALDWWKARGTEKSTSTVADAVSLNGALREALRDERADNLRKDGRVVDLETQNALLYERLREQRRDYEAELDALRNQLSDVSDRLAALQVRLRSDLPGIGS